MIIFLIITEVIIHRLKKREFCERLYANYLTMDEETQKWMMRKGIFYNVVPFLSFFAGSFFMLMYVLQ